MGAYANIDIDVQDLLATILTVGSEYDLDNPDSESGLDGRAILYHRIVELGWTSPTEQRAMRGRHGILDQRDRLDILGEERL
jgi:hypothetical protein